MNKLSLRNSLYSRAVMFLAAVSFVFLGVTQTQSARAANTLNVVSNSQYATYYSEVLKGADRLITLQNSNGSWDWIVTDATGPTSNTYYNIAGVTAQELLDAYTLSKDSKYLTAAENAGNYIVSQSTAVGGSNNMSTGRQNAYNIVFLLNLGTASGNSTYTTTGADIYNTIFTAANYWSTNNGSFCNASTGCTAAELVSGDENLRSGTGYTNPDGIIPWDLVTFVKAAKLLNDNTTANALQLAINNYVTGANYTSSIGDYSLGLSSAISAAVLVGADTSTLMSTLAAVQGASGQFGTASDGQTQATSYALMALKAAGDTSSVSSNAASYISSQFSYTANAVTYNGWQETGSASTTEYSEVDSEAGHALFTYFYQPNTYYSISDAYNAASDGDTINIAAGTYDLTAEFDISKAITISGQGSVTLQANNALWPTTDPSTKHIIGIYAGTSTAPITISNITIDCNSQCFGVNTYNNAYGELNNVTIKNSKGAGMTVNGSTIVADNLNTSGNSWGSVNIDPGSGVTTPSVFTLTGTGTLAESNQIWSDGSHVTGTATVTVNATGYTQYLKAGTTTNFWINQPITSAAVLEHSGSTNAVYSTINAAYTAAVDGDTIYVGSGNYSENLSISKQISLVGPNASINPNSNATRSTEAVITGQITVYSGNVNIKGLTITNPLWSGVTIKGLQIYSASSVLSGIDVENNIFSNIENAQAHGSYGVMVQGVVDGVTVKNNKFDNITSTGWAHALEVTPTCNSTTVPQNVSVTGNNFSNITATGGDQYAFSVDWCDATNIADASQVTFTNNNMLTGTAVRNLDTAHHLEASGNWWGQVSGPTSSQVSTGVDYTPWLTAEGSALDTDVPVITLNGDSDITMFVGDTYTEQGATAEDATQGDLTADIKTSGAVNASTAGDYTITYTASDAAGNTGTATRTVHVEAANQNVSVGNSGSGPSTINVPKGIDTKIDLSSIVAAGSGNSQQATLNNQLNINSTTGSGTVNVQIPANITITGPSDWDGKINAPQVVTTSPAPMATDPGTSIGYTTFEVGAGSIKLTFDKSVRLLFAGKAGQRISYFDGTTPIEITTTCTTDTQSAADAQLIGSVTECKIDSGSDLAVWTKHFTEFVTFTVNQVTASSGGGGGGGYVPTSTPAATTTPAHSNNGQVLGQITINSDPNGTLILDNGTVYIISNGQRRAFRSAEEFNSYGYKFSQVIPASDADKLLPEGPIMTLLDGTLVLDTSDNRTIYLIGSNGIKRGFASAGVFTSLGYKFSQAVKFNLTGYQAGDAITSATAAHPDGALVFDGQTVWWVNNGQLHGFPTLDIFNSYGLSFKNMVPANAADKALPQGSTVLALKDALAGGSYFLALK